MAVTIRYTGAYIIILTAKGNDLNPGLWQCVYASVLALAEGFPDLLVQSIYNPQ